MAATDAILPCASSPSRGERCRPVRRVSEHPPDRDVPLGAIDAQDELTQYRRLVADAPMAVIGIDEQAKIVTVNPEAEQMFGFARDELVGRDVATLAADPQAAARRALQLTVGPGRPRSRRFGMQRPLQARRRDGSAFAAEVSMISVATGTGRVSTMVLVADVSARASAEQQLSRRIDQQHALAQLAEQALEGAEPDELLQLACELAFAHTAAELATVALAGPARRWTAVAAPGWPRQALSAAGVDDGEEGRVHDGDLDGQALTRSLHDSHVTSTALARVGAHGDGGGTLAVHAGARDAFDRSDEQFLRALAGILGDALARLDAERRIAHQSLHDTLTGLANRTLLAEHYRRWLTVRAPQAPAAMLLVDVDEFKVVNDSLGHDAGDELLGVVAQRLLAHVQPQDIVARLGADEFAVLCLDLEQSAEPLVLAERVRHALSAPLDLRDVTHELSVSVGVALAGDPALSAEELLRNATMAAHRAKRRGRAQVEVYDRVLHLRMLRRVHLERELRVALDDPDGRGLHLRYQPVYRLRDGCLEGFEALARWDHPDDGPLSPGEFIPMAEDSGLIVPLGQRIMLAAARQAADWRRRLPGAQGAQVAVNLSPRQAADPQLVDTVARTLELTGLTADELWLEVTETALLEQDGIALQAMGQLREMGVHLALDDFGTGYSSLSHVQHFPVSSIKIDKSFVDSVQHNRGSRAVIASIVRLAEGFDATVVAEGVEDVAQALALRELGCDLVQGFLFAPGIDPASAEQLICRRHWNAPVEPDRYRPERS